MASYDPKVIQAFADDLYSRATSLVVMNVLFFALVGAIAGFFLGQATGAAILLAVGAAVGFYLGSQRAFLLKLQAQTALCQVEIERNTRLGSPSIEAAPQPAQATTETAAAGERASTPEGLSGKCPNCTRTIPLSSTECPRCKADFSAGSAWKVQPL